MREFPATYAKTVQVAAAIATGPIARPSSPSVRFTAFDIPTITMAANGTYHQPRLGATFFRTGNGTAVPIELARKIATGTATANCSRSFPRAERPRELRPRSFR